MEKRFRWTKFNHIFQNGFVSALYNSLNMKPIFVDSNMVNIVKCFHDGRTLSEVMKETSIEQRYKLEKLFPILNEAKILVDADGTDDDILEFFRNYHTGHPYVSIAYFILTDACNFG